LTSERKITANRANARASTGPQTTRGGARAARNALRHGLSLPARSIPALSEEVETLAGEIAGPGANVATQELARRVAETQIDLRRVRCARHKLLSDALAKAWDVDLDRRSTGVGADETPSGILRYLSRAEVQSERRIQWGILTNGRHWRLY
jgi:hypothetical protein